MQSNTSQIVPNFFLKKFNRPICFWQSVAQSKVRFPEKEPWDNSEKRKERKKRTRERERIASLPRQVKKFWDLEP